VACNMYYQDNANYYANYILIRIMEILHKELSYKINGILFEVHNKLSRFFSHKQYCDAIEILFK